jgi:glycosyltransferase involved in cell wall biosynthesis
MVECSCLHEPLRIMVYMPHHWRGGFFRVACMLCNELSSMTFRGRTLTVFLSVPQGYEFERELIGSSVTVTTLVTTSVSAGDVRFIPPDISSSYSEVDYDIPLITPLTTHPFNERSLIDSIDGYILLNALFYEGVFVSRKPYAVYIADIIQRHVPEIYDTAAGYRGSSWFADRNQRATLKNASAVFVTTPGTMMDTLVYGGVERAKIIKFPLFYVPINQNIRDRLYKCDHVATTVDLLKNVSIDHSHANYFLWVTNATPHKNHLCALEMLKQYYSLGGTLKCYVCGPMTYLLTPGESDLPYLQSIYHKLTTMNGYEDNLCILSYADEITYFSLLKHSKFLWHNVLYDNGTFTIIEAASLGVPVLTSDYPQIRYIVEQFDIPCSYFNARSVKDGAEKLLQMENGCREKKIYTDVRKEFGPEGSVKLSPLDASLRDMLSRMFPRS